MKNAVLLLLPCIVFFTGCSKKNSSDGTRSGGTKLHRVLTEGKLSLEYTYNAGGFVTRQTFYTIGNKKSSETVYSYDASNKLVKTESFIDVSSSSTAQQLAYSYTEYSYGTDARLNEERTFVNNGAQSELRSIITPAYDAAGRIVSRLQQLNNKPINLYTYEYNNQGNIIKQETYRYDSTTRILGFRTTYEHDDKNNPYINLSVMPFSVNRNNIIKSTTTNYNLTPGTPVVTTSETLIKKYNANHLPLEVVEHGTVHFTYEYR